MNKYDTNKLIGFNSAGDKVIGLVDNIFETDFYNRTENKEYEYDLIFETNRHKVYESKLTNKRIYREKI